MSYLVLARKYRPQSFDEVAGQEHVTRTLQNAIKSGRLAHAYLFSGSRGVGKTSIARILAKAINCEKNKDGSPCNKCSSCEEITAGTSVDVIEIDAASNRGIDSVRELREGVRYAPARSKFKVYIIDEVHMLTKEAWNALLKTLEEPPDHAIFLFATTEVHKVLPTILSRVQRFDFRRLTPQGISEQITKVLKDEKIGLSDEAIQLVARLSEGGMRDALSLLDLVSASFDRDTKKQPITEQEVADLTGVAGRELIEQTLEAIVKKDALAVITCVEKLYDYGYDVQNFYKEVLGGIRDALVMRATGEKAGEVMDLPESSVARLKEIFDGCDTTFVDQLFLIFQSGEQAVFNSAHQRYVLEALLLRMAQAEPLESLGAIDERLARIEGSLGSGGGGAPARRGPPARPTEGAAPARAAAPDTQSKPESSSIVSGAEPGCADSGNASAAAPVPPGQEIPEWRLIAGNLAERKMRWRGMLSAASLRMEARGVVLVPTDDKFEKARRLMGAEDLTELLRTIGEELAGERGGEAPPVILGELDLSVREAAPERAQAKAEARSEELDERARVKREARENPVVAQVLDKFSVGDINIRKKRG
ncbi:MAG: DNA polymerase III subunit gamma/tau [Chrysiogenetes bacterium]|nr:DNA polymerase III subunit gamma/tau [Chrysiogenetes bacterium]